MFKKAVEVKSQQRLSGADRKKLKRTLKDRFLSASDSDIDILLPPKVPNIIFQSFFFVFRCYQRVIFIFILMFLFMHAKINRKGKKPNEKLECVVQEALAMHARPRLASSIKHLLETQLLPINVMVDFFPINMMVDFFLVLFL